MEPEKLSFWNIVQTILETCYSYTPRVCAHFFKDALHNQDTVTPDTLVKAAARKAGGAPCGFLLQSDVPAAPYVQVKRVRDMGVRPLPDAQAPEARARQPVLQAGLARHRHSRRRRSDSALLRDETPPMGVRRGAPLGGTRQHWGYRRPAGRRAPLHGGIPKLLRQREELVFVFPPLFTCSDVSP